MISSMPGLNKAREERGRPQSDEIWGLKELWRKQEQTPRMEKERKKIPPQPLIIEHSIIHTPTT
jgi:hypothetical protein